MTAREVAAVLEAWAPLSIQESWDNAGFCIGLPQTEVKGVLLCLDVNLAVVEEALQVGANMIISHHPLIFQGLKQICGQNELARVVAKAIQHDLVLYAAHTNADKVSSGVSGQMADLLGLVEQEILRPDEQADAASPIGLGIIGNLSGPEEVRSFLLRVKQCFALSCLRTGPLHTAQIRRVAVCGGSGSSLIAQAQKRGADIFLSGDISYHHFFPGEGPMIVADMGHYESEIGIIGRFVQVLSEKNLTFAVHTTRHSANPVHYF
ncbi:MAG: Nif3-like dinuclear metal center hexameric protein [Bacteroidales bacterium]|nr:Nif3-like dinuclear metal center hexameric protein [Bacteroidales bacterium]MCL2738165.1 Nif3-like dinuclear metal center hexameric protein [Bacteroidales bacterium]